uniref:Uncharacterized protein n=1 Tax=Ditylum brightwellii TaxID=49249 RepID=A0A7S4VT18_9STRA
MKANFTPKVDFETIVENVRRKHQEGQVWCENIASFFDESFCCSPVHEEVIAEIRQNEQPLQYREHLETGGIGVGNATPEYRDDKSTPRSSQRIKISRKGSPTYEVQLPLQKVFSTSMHQEVNQNRHKCAIQKINDAPPRHMDSHHESTPTPVIHQNKHVFDKERFEDSNDNHFIKSFASAETETYGIRKSSPSNNNEKRFIESPGHKYVDANNCLKAIPMRKVNSTALPALSYLTLTEGYNCC